MFMTACAGGKRILKLWGKGAPSLPAGAAPSPRTQTQKVARQKYLPGHFSLQKAFKAAFYPLLKG